jgi:hypothetical protein
LFAGGFECVPEKEKQQPTVVSHTSNASLDDKEKTMPSTSTSTTTSSSTSQTLPISAPSQQQQQQQQQSSVTDMLVSFLQSPTEEETKIWAWLAKGERRQSYAFNKYIDQVRKKFESLAFICLRLFVC